MSADGTESRRERAQQEKLLVALDAAGSQLRRDECGWWVIGGRQGAIHTWGDDATWVAFIQCRSARQWNSVKRQLGFMTVTQDGDDEGCLRLFRLPTPDEAVMIREVLGLRKQRHLSQSHREALIAGGSTHRFRARRSAEAPLPDIPVPADSNGPQTRRTAPPDPSERVPEEEVV